MRKFQWLGVLAVGLAVVVVAGGCRSRRGGAGASGLGGTNVIDDLPPLGGEPIPMGGDRLEGDALGIRFDPVYFDYDSSQVKTTERVKIEAVATHLRGNAAQKLIVEGHGDERGSAEYNLALGERRAQSVRSYLVGLGIAAERVQTASFGEERPAEQGSGEAVWQKNRRAEFSVLQ